MFCQSGKISPKSGHTGRQPKNGYSLGQEEKKKRATITDEIKTEEKTDVGWET